MYISESACKNQPNTRVLISLRLYTPGILFVIPTPMKKKENIQTGNEAALSNFAGSYTKTTRNIQVTVIPNYIEEQSDPSAGVFSFSYKVLMRNLGKEGVELINRHWMVFSDESQIADVKGEGVAGQQPVLEPGEEFSYSSWTTIVDPTGSMKGSYTFCTEDGEFFDVEVPQFSLTYFDTSTLH